MREATALEVAVGLLQLPSRVRTLRDGELPADLDTLLHIVAGDDQALLRASSTLNVTPRVVREAASFYIEQILLHPEADSYRALGSAPDATPDQLRRNMALLLRWLHPDRDADNHRSVFASRVTKAWNDVKTDERRAAYDAARLTTRSVGAKGGSFTDLVRPARASEAASRTSATAGALTRGDRIGPRRRLRAKGVWYFLRYLIGRERR